jgi:hypothetical protein
MNTELAVSVINEKHLSITDEMVRKVEAFLANKPEVRSYSANNSWENSESLELIHGKIQLRIQMTYKQ